MTTAALIIAMTLYFEARSGGPRLIEAVASTIWNRSQITGKRLAEVCQEKGAYSCWNLAEPWSNLNRELVRRDWVSNLPKADYDAWIMCMATADAMVRNDYEPMHAQAVDYVSGENAVEEYLRHNPQAVEVDRVKDSRGVTTYFWRI